MTRFFWKDVASWLYLTSILLQCLAFSILHPNSPSLEPTDELNGPAISIGPQLTQCRVPRVHRVSPSLR